MLIVDDEPIVSDGIKELFEENFGDIFQIYNLSLIHILFYRKNSADLYQIGGDGMKLRKTMRGFRRAALCLSLIHIYIPSGSA